MVPSPPRTTPRPPSPSAGRGGRPGGIHVEASGIGQSFGGVAALSEVSFEAGPGAVVCLLGHSGCGKSTLLRVIAGLQQPDAGMVRFDGQIVTGPGILVAPERRGLGFMVQDYALFPHLSVGENIAFGLRDRRKAGDIVAAELARVGLTGFEGRYPHMLSGGEQQRVALARALAPGPRLLLLDEPFSNLDRSSAAAVRHDTLAVLKEAGTSAIIVTHDPEEALRIADRIVLMEAGRVVQVAQPREIYARPANAFAGRFFGALTECHATVRDGVAVTPLGSFAAGGFDDGARVVVGIRPWAVSPVLREAGDAAGIAATVSEAVFAGSHVAVVARLDDGTPVGARAPSRVDFAPGASVRLHVDPSGVVVFPASRP